MDSTAPQTTMPDIPDGETYVIHGRIIDTERGGGGYDTAPGHVQRCIERSDGSSQWLTTSSLLAGPCGFCIKPPANEASTYGGGSWVLITSLHGHYVIRLLDELFRH